MKQKFIPLAIAAALATSGFGVPHDHTLEQVLDTMERAGRSFRGLEANIERTKVTVIVNDKAVDSGKVYFSRSGTKSRIKLDITRPESQNLLIDNGQALLYFPRIKQVQKYFLGKNQDKAEFLLIGFGQANAQLKQYYNVILIGEEVLDGARVSVLELKPKSRQVAAMFATIRLWVDQQRWIPVQSKLTEASGDYLILKFTNIKLNMKIPDSVFKLKLPKDVQVVTL